MQMDRRLFLALLPAPFYPAIPLTVLSGQEAHVVESLCAQIIPADDFPGAKEAGVLFYIETQLAGPYAHFAPDYHKGIAAFQEASLAKTSKRFDVLSFPEQTQFLKQIESQPASQANHFFQLVIDHTMQGFYGSPKHGGNKDHASWNMLQIADVMEGHKQ